MLYAIFSEYEPIHIDKVREKVREYYVDREKHPEKYPKQVFEPHNLAGGPKAIQIVEATYEQLLNLRKMRMPYTRYEFVPIYKSSELAEKFSFSIT